MDRMIYNVDALTGLRGFAFVWLASGTRARFLDNPKSISQVSSVGFPVG